MPGRLVPFARPDRRHVIGPHIGSSPLAGVAVVILHSDRMGAVIGSVHDWARNVGERHD